MSTTIDRLTETGRDGEIALAREKLLRRAEAQGIKPVTSLETLAGDPEVTADFDVNEFLLQLRQDRDRRSTENVE